uniref:Uncharacterized protein n=1 Tax=Escherichia coli TaxID=562 RepID=A0A7L8K9V7_ECOLX|nr:hypothetical protein [Escherichia coli]UCK65493.1 hypothetical protein [Providencia rettgeri]
MLKQKKRGQNRGISDEFPLSGHLLRGKMKDKSSSTVPWE